MLKFTSAQINAKLKGKYVKAPYTSLKDGILNSCDKVIKAWVNEAAESVECRVVSPIDKQRYNITLNKTLIILDANGGEINYV